MTGNFGERLKQLLHDKNLTQNDLANATGITQSGISHYINNSRMPNTEALIKIAQFLRVTTDELLGVKKQKTTNLDAWRLMTVEQIAREIAGIFVHRIIEQKDIEVWLKEERYF